jgi:hypothetical protein
MRNTLCKLLASAMALAHMSAAAWAEDSAQDLAKKLSNPVADLISVPFQGNWNHGIGPDAEGDQYYVNVQPVIPFHLNKDWNLISRTILPVVTQNDILPGSGNQYGLGNTQQSLFFSPVKPTHGIIWGVGPIAYLHTASDQLLGPDKWGAGPTGVALWQGGPWTAGILANQIWSFAGDSDEADINQAYFQPFIAYTTKDAWTFSLNSESTYYWDSQEWSVPFNAQIQKLVHFDKQPIALYVGARYWAVTEEGVGPNDWGVRAGMTFLFPKK